MCRDLRTPPEAEDGRGTAAPGTLTAEQEVWRFFGVVLLGSAPFYIAGALLPVQLVPGVPLSVFSVVVPALGAWFGARRSALVRPRDLLRDCVHPRVRALARWYGLALTLYPGVLAADYTLRTALGVVLPRPEWQIGSLLGVTAFSVVAGLLEELGWTGFATRALRTRRGRLPTAVAVGLVWTVWHWVPLGEVGRSADWIAWWSLYSVASRLILVCLFDGSRSVWVCAAYHAMLNIAWQAYPVDGSAWDPRSVALLVSAVSLVWWFASNRTAPTPGEPNQPEHDDGNERHPESRSRSDWP